MVRGLSQRPNLTEGPAATWDLRRSIKEEEEEIYLSTIQTMKMQIMNEISIALNKFVKPYTPAGFEPSRTR
jgi:hypothetical protein